MCENNRWAFYMRIFTNKIQTISVSRATFQYFLFNFVFKPYFQSLFVSLGDFIRKTKTVVYTRYTHTYPQFCQKLFINKDKETTYDSTCLKYHYKNKSPLHNRNGLLFL